MSEDDLLAIGSLAEVTGVAVTTLRYYDDIGLISTATRIGGKRRFDVATSGRVNFVRRAQQVGFSLDEIRHLLDEQSTDWATLVVGRLASLHTQREELDTMIAVLEDVQKCGCASVATCPRLADRC